MLNRTSSYALSAVLRIAEGGGGSALSAAGLAEALDLPTNYVGKILNRLAREGILVSHRGRSGGFHLSRSASEISLADVVGAFETVGERRCLIGRAECGGPDACALHQEWERVRGPVDAFLSETTLDQVPPQQRELSITSSEPAPRPPIRPADPTRSSASGAR